MKRIEAIINPFKIDEVKEALTREGLDGMTVSEVKVCGSQTDQRGTYRGALYAIDLHPKIKIELVVSDDQVASAVSVLEQAARTGNVGDGRIFVLPIEDAVRIRTGEHGVAAIRSRSRVVRDTPALSHPRPRLVASRA